jgi:hypothetical protein
VDGRDKLGHDGVRRFDYFAASPCVTATSA